MSTPVLVDSPERRSHRRPKGRKSIAHPPIWDSGLVQEPQQENLTESLVGAPKDRSFVDKASRRKLRSKSLGPGGLEALNSISGNARKPVSPRPRSILKPTIPLSPLREIPSRGPVAENNANIEMASESGNSENRSTLPIVDQSEEKTVQNPGSSSSTGIKMHDLGSRSSEDDQKAREKEEIKRRRESRRKSLAGRRVSFAPEATLHTWDLVEEAQDSTTSTNSTRRRSSLSNASTSEPPLNLHVHESPVQASNTNASMNPEESNAVSESPAGRTRKMENSSESSGIPALNLNDAKGVQSSHPSNGSSVDSENSSNIPRSPDSSPRDSAQASKQITARIGDQIENLDDDGYKNEPDDEDDMSMDLATVEIVAPVQQKSHSTLYSQSTAVPLEAANEQENLYTYSNHRTPQRLDFNGYRSPSENDEDLSMDLTRPLGNILELQSWSQASTDAVSSQRRISDVKSQLDDQSMDITAAIGIIQSSAHGGKETVETDENEDLSMDFTEAIGRIRDRPIQSQPHGDYLANLDFVEENSRKEMDDTKEHEMDFTRALGAILPGTTSSVPPTEKHTEEGIISRPTNPSSPIQELDRELEDKSMFASSPLRSRPRQRPSLPNKSPSTSPSPRGSTPRQGIVSRNASPEHTKYTALSAQRKKQTMVPGQGSHSANSTPRGKSRNIFHRDPKSGGMTPTVVFAPSIQRGSQAQDLKYDRAGLGSPKVAALLDRRHSIGETAAVFSPLSFDPNNIRYEDPRPLDQEVEQQREADARRENGRALLEQEANANVDNVGAVSFLKEAIGSMSPKKSNIRSRKSLAVGSARGLLGKRPAELDDEDDCNSTGSPDIMRQSPVKKVRLQAHQASTAASRRRMTEVSGNARPVTPRTSSPLKSSATTPRSQAKFRDASALPSAEEELPTMGQMASEDAMEVSIQNAEPIELQEFLNMTSIRFMDLTTSKRRHTAVTQCESNTGITETASQNEDTEPFKQMEDAIIAGACVHPWLELFQHSCRELKKYIAEGKSLVKKIEQDTHVENPPIFQEYISATPAERGAMDNQFKDMKTNARLQSRATWYEWRRELLQGLKQILDPIEQDFSKDSASLEVREKLISEILPSLLVQQTLLTQERAKLQHEADELADCNQEELGQTRSQLQSVTEALAAKRQLVQERRRQFGDTVKTLSGAEEAREETLGAIREAVKVSEECRGWSISEIRQLKERVNALQLKHGWSILHAENSNLLLQYRRNVDVLINMSAFQLTGAGMTNQQNEKAVVICRWRSDSKRMERVMWFLLPRLQDHLNSLSRMELSVKQVLSAVASAHETCRLVSTEIAELDKHCITWVDPFRDAERGPESSQSLLVEASLLLQQLQTKIKISFTLTTPVSRIPKLDLVLKRLESQVSYGQQFSQTRMETALRAQTKKNISGDGAWRDAVLELRGRLLGKSAKDDV